MTESTIGHADQFAVVSAQREPYVEVQGAVRPHQDPVGATPQHRPLELRSFEAAPLDYSNAAIAQGRLAEVLDLMNLERNGKQMRDLDISHDVPPGSYVSRAKSQTAYPQSIQ
jgi:hypothetical protein